MRLTNQITGIILAGGTSRRMGMDKALLKWEGQSFIKRIFKSLKTLTEEVIIVSDNPSHQIEDTTLVADVYKDGGPLAGLYAGLMASRTECNLLLGCDTPFVRPDLLNKLIDAIEPGFDIIMYRRADEDLPLLALYHKSCEKKCAELLRMNEFRLLALKDHCSVKSIDVEEEAVVQISNVNTMNDYYQLDGHHN